MMPCWISDDVSIFLELMMAITGRRVEQLDAETLDSWEALWVSSWDRRAFPTRPGPIRAMAVWVICLVVGYLASV